MRNLPSNLSDFLYLIQKMGFSYLRGIFFFISFKFGSSIPFLGRNIKIINSKKIFFNQYVWLGHNGYLDACCEESISFGRNVTVRENFSIQSRSGLNQKGTSLFIGDNCFFGPFLKIGLGESIIFGKNCQVGSHCSFNAESHVYFNKSYTSGKISRKGIKIDDNVWIGDGVIILDGVSIGKNSVIGAGSVVTKSIPSNTLSFGVPAKVIRKIG